jgi:hypothetical protein
MMPTKVETSWHREIRIFDFCIWHGRQIIAELESSGGDHSEDIQCLYDCIDAWDHFRSIAEEALLNEKRGAGRR